MTVDLNKGLSTPITYNYLNLPEVVTKSVNNIRYIYDAAGRKLSQIVRTGLAVNQTDYAGEFIYENDFLRFVNHEEGRIVVSSEKLLYKHDGDVIEGLTALNTTLTPMTINGEKYISASSGGSGSGIFPIGNAINVVPGEKYLIRVKGYRSDYNVAIMVRRNNSTITYGSYLPALVANESWIEQIYVVPANTTTMEVGIGWNSPTGTAHLFLNAFELIKLESSTPEYQYNLKDHLGNVRFTFTTKQDIESNTATLEDENAEEEQGKFLRYDNTRIVNHFLFDHTKGSKPTQVEGGAQRLSGQGNEIYGLAKSLSVMPGDVINMEVYAKYIDPNESNRTAALNTLIMQIAAGTAPGGTVIDGGSYAASTSSFPFPADATQNTSSSSEASPKAFLSWLVYDRNYTLIASKSGFRQMSSVAKEDGSDVAHELLSGTVTITEPGYIYVFLSNEQGTNPYEVYFDDFNVEQVKSPVTQTQDYYSFGLEFNSSQRENSLSQDYKYNGKEDQTALGLGWLDYNARKYMPEIGRWNAIDYMSEKYNSHSPYAYVLNNPIALVDPDGNDVYLIVYYTK
jgi:RHS repeat-associated protein